MIGRYITTSGKTIADIQTLMHIIIAILPLLFLEFGQELFPMALGKLRRVTVLRWAVYLAVFAMIILLGVHDGSSFIYVSF